jgi:hypothetical protein
MSKLTCSQCSNAVSPIGVSCHTCGQVLPRDAAMTPIFRQPHGRLGDCDPLLQTMRRRFQAFGAQLTSEENLLIVMPLIPPLIPPLIVIVAALLFSLIA